MMTGTRFALPLTLFATACGGDPAPPSNSNSIELPEPSGPPVADISRARVGVGDGADWQVRNGRIIYVSRGATRLSLACTDGAILKVRAHGFQPVGSEDRFTFGLGEEPYALVADPYRQSEPGVEGEGPVPDKFDDLFSKAKTISVVYGSQQIGPLPAPPQPIRNALLERCGAK